MEATRCLPYVFKREKYLISTFSMDHKIVKDKFPSSLTPNQMDSNQAFMSLCWKSSVVLFYM